ncbi:HlyD family efflux transporter periplasmic adaptor subunit [Niabella sp. CC-SYL272]|uniref:HlyD family secretion protein n=1 Tax=Niabella agricola TaxID=2891571 RepID=UPI001F2194C4|nr:HlyD family efflux transporter periplasmic adaptor subunit [Niabella agricola]MCF3111996.1 HlyD family efflux transporter periplasmic adaptor subunit [Niabella agricola]
MKLNFLSGLFLILLACNGNKKKFDAAGNFEADEVIVSAEQNGTILRFSIQEGDALQYRQVAGQIDVSLQQLQREQTQATIGALQQQVVSPLEEIRVAQRQLATQESLLQNQKKERLRLQNLVAAAAAPQKQLDDMDAQIIQTEKQMAVTRQQISLYRSNAATRNRALLSERAPLEKAKAQTQLQVEKGQIINPVAGIVLTKYALQGEMTTIGRPLYKIANLDTLTLRAYITGDQLPLLKLQQPVTVRIDHGNQSYKNYRGIISWISDKAEFTPKTIQTKNERANLVYAVKIRVKNDGYLKIGMYGEVLFNEKK